MKNIIDLEKFSQAQKFESAYWLSRQHDAVGIIHDLESPFELAQHLQTKGYLAHRWDRFLDLGCGGLGIGLLWLIKSDEAYGIDPLPVLPPETGCDLLDSFINGVQSKTKYLLSKAESMQFQDSHFDLIVCNNVLDHVHNPSAILSEVKRCLLPQGLFAFAVDTHSLRGLIGRKLLRTINPNYGSLIGHPYEWTENQMTNLLIKHGFRIESHTPRSPKGRWLGRVRRTTWLLRHA